MTVNIIQKAREFAIKAHQGQTRKTSGKPYIGHPFRVAKILEDAGMSVELVIAAMQHDVVEDTTYTIEDIQAEFGDKVTRLVAFNTEDKSKTWEQRKTHTIEQLKTGTIEEKALVVADKYANLLEMAEDTETFGEEAVWASFKRGKADQYWYFYNVGKSGLENLKEDEIPKFFLDYMELVDRFFVNNK